MNKASVYICPLHLEPPSHRPVCPSSLGHHGAPGVNSLGHTANPHSAIYFTNGMYVFQWHSLNSSRPLLPLCVHKSALYVRVSPAVLQIGSWAPSFSIQIWHSPRAETCSRAPRAPRALTRCFWGFHRSAWHLASSGHATQHWPFVQRGEERGEVLLGQTILLWFYSCFIFFFFF